MVDDHEAAALLVDAQFVLPAGKGAEYLGRPFSQGGQRLVEDPLLEVSSIQVRGKTSSDVTLRLNVSELGPQLLGRSLLLDKLTVVRGRLSERLLRRSDGVGTSGNVD